MEPNECYSMSAVLGSLRENGSNFCFLRDDSHHFEKIGCRHFRAYRDDVTTCTVLSRRPCQPLKTVPWGSSHWINRREAKVFFQREDSPFLKKLFLDFVGPTKMIIWLAEYFSKYLLCLFRLFPDVLEFVITRKRGRKVFFSLEVLPFPSENCAFKNLLGVTEMI